MRVLTVLALLVAGCSASPVTFHRSKERLECKYLKKCNRAEFDRQGYDSVADCREERLPDDDLEDRVDDCEVYDAAEARLCLNGLRKNIRECDRGARSSDQVAGCDNACRD